MTSAPDEIVVSQEELTDRPLPIAYQTFGDPADEPLLLVMGLGGPMTWWKPEFCAMLARAGFFVIRFDNRDIGHSGRSTGRVSMAQMAAAFVGARVRAPYSIGDMADDAFGVLDALGIESAHVCGMSMGGMIVQTMAIARPDRVRSLVSIMSTTGRRTVGWQHPTIMPELLRPSRNREEYVEGSIRMWRLIGSSRFPAGDVSTRARAEETWERGVRSSEVGRQMMAVLTQPDRTADLGRLRMPTTVIHSLGDKMVNVSGGRATSMAIPGSELLLIDGMGHDLPEELWSTFVTAIAETAERVTKAV
jgi:pimeloyl-ACP methyl ester carboxylesterase